jgi:dTDP-4-amino-4,6-dideoxygalactose transaminase
VIRIAEPRIGEKERQAVLDVLASGRLTAGPYTQRLEEAFASEVSGTTEAIAVSSGTAALHLALLAHGIGAGDEVITTPFSFQATANMVLATGAHPVFVDVAEDGNLDPSLVEAAITSHTKAILPVHLYGRLCDMEAMCDIAARHHLALIEDAAQAHGARMAAHPSSSPSPRRERGPGREDHSAGSFGTGCFSLYATKNLMAGEGGVITTNDPDLAKRLRRLRHHGEDGRYESVELGYNYRITEAGAALALTQLEGLQEANQRRRDNATYLTRHLRGVHTPASPADPASHVWHQYTVRVVSPLFLPGKEEGARGRGRDDLQRHLREKGIEAMVYYPMTLPSQKLYRDLGYDDSAFPTARRLTNEVLSLPVHPGLGATDLEAIVEAVNEWTQAHAAERAIQK